MCDVAEDASEALISISSHLPSWARLCAPYLELWEDCADAMEDASTAASEWMSNQRTGQDAVNADLAENAEDSPSLLSAGRQFLSRRGVAYFKHIACYVPITMIEPYVGANAASMFSTGQQLLTTACWGKIFHCGNAHLHVSATGLSVGALMCSQVLLTTCIFIQREEDACNLATGGCKSALGQAAIAWKLDLEALARSIGMKKSHGIFHGSKFNVIVQTQLLKPNLTLLCLLFVQHTCSQYRTTAALLATVKFLGFFVLLTSPMGVTWPRWVVFTAELSRKDFLAEWIQKIRHDLNEVMIMDEDMVPMPDVVGLVGERK